MRIVHLSDIHFRKAEIQTAQDPNAHLRNEILRDIQVKATELGKVDLIIVSGDISYSGDVDEFKFASDWLKQVTDACGADPTIFVVPGNHDIVRKIADRPIVQLLHKEIKNSSEINIEATIRSFLSESETARLIYESLANYNDFANQYLYDLLPPDRTRAVRNVTLNDGSTLTIWGINTTFVSSSYDKPGDLFVDTAALQISRHTGVTNVVVGHHEMSWLRQKQALEDHLNDVAPVQIFGHVHTNRINMGRDWLRLTASAANPDRREAGWEPGYNIIELGVETEGEQRWLKTRTHVRVWQTAPGGFHAKMDRDKPYFDHKVQLEPWKPEQGKAEVSNEAHSLEPTAPELLSMKEEDMATMRNLGLRFYKLTFSQKSEIAGRLNLLEDTDIGQPDFEKFRRVFFRASERGVLADLEDAIDQMEMKRQG